MGLFTFRFSLQCLDLASYSLRETGPSFLSFSSIAAAAVLTLVLVITLRRRRAHI